ncbi:M56 family metallopeptidase [Candidatus Soleaferrea massiliensis]|uniref:M56 family metallopeptidase n=1 Tax=Candidatus Soleaferrea massiliensis TaxID=1470354 RepID=UPI00058B5DC0|nr:M56 family metallopeptidase [Candidatus Soleaferrea massiliensis]
MIEIGSFIFSLLICSGVVSLIGLVYILVRPLLANRYSAKGRYYVWIVLLVALLIPLRPQLPSAPIQISPPDLTIRQASPAPSAGQDAHNSKNQTAASAVIPSPDNDQEHEEPNIQTNPSTAQTSPPISINWYQILFGIWLIGAGSYFGIQMKRHLRFVRFAKRWSRKVTDETELASLHALCTYMNIKQPIALSRCQVIEVPMLVGIRRPTILLPQKAYACHELPLLLKHELTHHRRHDLWYKLLVLIVTSLHWFNPVVHLLGRYIALDCEISCDREVISSLDACSRQYYGQTLIDFAARTTIRQTALSTNFFGGVSMMKERLQELFFSNKRRRGISLTICIALCILVLSGLVSIAADHLPADSGSSVIDDVDASHENGKATEYMIGDIPLDSVQIGYNQFDEPENKQLIWETYVEEYNSLPWTDQSNLIVKMDMDSSDSMRYMENGYFRSIQVNDEASGTHKKFIINRLTPKTAQVCIDLLYQNKDEVLGLIQSFLNTEGLSQMSTDEMVATNGFPFNYSMRFYAANPQGEPENSPPLVDTNSITLPIYPTSAISDTRLSFLDFTDEEYAPTAYPKFELDLVEMSMSLTGFFDSSRSAEEIERSLHDTFGDGGHPTEEWKAMNLLRGIDIKNVQPGSLDDGVCITLIVNRDGEPVCLSTFVSVGYDAMHAVTHTDTP